MKILIKIGIGASVALNVFIIVLTSYVWLNAEKRFNENRKFIKDTIIEEVYKQIKFVIPKESGGVYVPNKWNWSTKYYNTECCK